MQTKSTYSVCARVHQTSWHDRKESCCYYQKLDNCIFGGDVLESIPEILACQIKIMYINMTNGRYGVYFKYVIIRENNKYRLQSLFMILCSAHRYQNVNSSRGSKINCRGAYHRE